MNEYFLVTKCVTEACYSESERSSQVIDFLSLFGGLFADEFSAYQPSILDHALKLVFLMCQLGYLSVLRFEIAATEVLFLNLLSFLPCVEILGFIPRL